MVPFPDRNRVFKLQGLPGGENKLVFRAMLFGDLTREKIEIRRTDDRLSLVAKQSLERPVGQLISPFEVLHGNHRRRMVDQIFQLCLGHPKLVTEDLHLPTTRLAPPTAGMEAFHDQAYQDSVEPEDEKSSQDVEIRDLK